MSGTIHACHVSFRVDYGGYSEFGMPVPHRFVVRLDELLLNPNIGRSDIEAEKTVLIPSSSAINSVPGGSEEGVENPLRRAHPCSGKGRKGWETASEMSFF